MDRVRGKVLAIGKKFNGSVKLGKDWYNFAKGLENHPKVGDEIILTLSPWEHNGKSGVNVSGWDLVLSEKHAFPNAEERPMRRTDWDAKDRRISRQGCIQVAVQVCPTFEGAILLADRMLEYVQKTDDLPESGVK